MTGFFSAGFLTGMALTSHGNRKKLEQVKEKYKKASHWLNEQNRKVMNRSKESMTQLAERFKKGLDNSIPNLYDATEEIIIDDSPTSRV